MKKNKKTDPTTIYIGADHNGFNLKENLKKYLAKKNYLIKDLGNTKFVATDDYPDMAKKVAKKVASNKDARGILICGSGQGMAMTANKFARIRAAVGWSVANAKRSRHDDDSNILCLSAWANTEERNRRITSAWLETAFSRIPRYQRRVKKIKA